MSTPAMPASDPVPQSPQLQFEFCIYPLEHHSSACSRSCTRQYSGVDPCKATLAASSACSRLSSTEWHVNQTPWAGDQQLSFALLQTLYHRRAIVFDSVDAPSPPQHACSSPDPKEWHVIQDVAGERRLISTLAAPAMGTIGWNM